MFNAFAMRQEKSALCSFLREMNVKAFKYDFLYIISITRRFVLFSCTALTVLTDIHYIEKLLKSGSELALK